MQSRFGFSSTDQKCQIGTGVMDEVWRGPLWTLPFLLLGSTRRVLFPSRGKNVPFTINNYAYVDSFGRETVTWARRFQFKNRFRAFDATMIHSKSRGMIIDYLGTHQHLATDIHCTVRDGAMLLTTGAQRFYEGPLAFRFPLIFSGEAEVKEWWDEDLEKYRIAVQVSNRLLGPLFGYNGSFDVVEYDCVESEIPLDVRPLREERRE